MFLASSISDRFPPADFKGGDGLQLYVDVSKFPQSGFKEVLDLGLLSSLPSIFPFEVGEKMRVSCSPCPWFTG